MAKTSNRVIGGLRVGLLAALALFTAVPVLAQETPDQFNAANAEQRRHTEAQQQIRNQAHDLRVDQGRALLGCQGAGSAAAQSACSNNVGINMNQRNLDLRNQIIQERNSHSQILQGIGVHRAP
jgi:hypothetical protein